jgi:transcriptional regulator with XRE-family HTH domain
VSQAQRIIGAAVRAQREQEGLTLEDLALRAGISYQYLSGLETGKENFTVAVLDALCNGLNVPMRMLVAGAYEDAAGFRPPMLNPDFFRDVPLPEGLTAQHIFDAANHAQLVVHRINRNMTLAAGTTLQSLIQGNNFSGLVSNLLTNALDEFSPYMHNGDTRYPDLINPHANGGAGEGLEVKTTIKIGKGGESHNGHSGWHVIACYQFMPGGDIMFNHIMFANLVGHLYPGSDWTYVGSKVNDETGSRRTETYTTSLQGTTKLRDGTVYIDPNFVRFNRWKQERMEHCPPYSIFHVQPSGLF